MNEQSWRIPSTGRSPFFQAKQLGFTSAADFAKSLPTKAVIADIGAGVSHLGHEVARLRPDITWVNIDPCYQDPHLRTALQKDLPANLMLLDANIVNGFTPPRELAKGADLVYSYWLLPHLSVQDDSAATAAAGHMYDLLKPGGALRVGPVKQLGFGLLSPFTYKGVVSHPKSHDKQIVVADIVRQTKLWWLPRLVQRLSNTYNIHFGMYFVGGRSKRQF